MKILKITEGNMDLLKTIVKSILILLVAGCQMQNQTLSQPINYEIFVDEVIRAFAKEVKEEWGFNCFSTGGSMPFDIESINVKFIAYRKASIEEARELEVALTEKLIKTINSHDQIRPFLREYPLTVPHAEVSIAFYNKRNQSEFENSISRVYQIKNVIYYEVENQETYQNVTLSEETYLEALHLVQTQINR